MAPNNLEGGGTFCCVLQPKWQLLHFSLPVTCSATTWSQRTSFVKQHFLLLLPQK